MDLTKKKVLFVAPHLSTGGLPQYLLKKIESITTSCDVYCVEYNTLSLDYVVQRNKIQSILGNKFYSLGDKPKTDLLSLIKDISPNIIHFEEFPETFIDLNLLVEIYNSTSRNYLIFETSHGVYFDVGEKRVFPDKFMFVSEYQREIYSVLGIDACVVEYPIEYKDKNKKDALAYLKLPENIKHVINIGLFTPGKNQAEVIKYADMLREYPIQFHFVGNLAQNFREYWEPILRILPPNCTVWGERKDVDRFYEAADLLLFTSKMETSPLVVREAISYKLSVVMYDLPAYKGMFNKFDNISFLSSYDIANAEHIKLKLGL